MIWVTVIEVMVGMGVLDYEKISIHNRTRYGRESEKDEGELRCS